VPNLGGAKTGAVTPVAPKTDGGAVAATDAAAPPATDGGPAPAPTPTLKIPPLDGGFVFDAGQFVPPNFDAGGFKPPWVK
jgi:hypothetical protein